MQCSKDLCRGITGNAAVWAALVARIWKPAHALPAVYDHDYRALLKDLNAKNCVPALASKTTSLRHDGHVECKVEKIALNGKSGELLLTFYVRARAADVPLPVFASLLIGPDGRAARVTGAEVRRVKKANMRVAEGMIAFAAAACAKAGVYRFRFGDESFAVAAQPAFTLADGQPLKGLFGTSLGVNALWDDPRLASWSRRRAPLRAAGSASPVVSAPQAQPHCALCGQVRRLLPAVCAHKLCSSCQRRLMADAVLRRTPNVPSPAFCPTIGCGVAAPIAAATGCLQPNELRIYERAAKGQLVSDTDVPATLLAVPSPTNTTAPVGYGDVPGGNGSPRIGANGANMRPHGHGYDQVSTPGSPTPPLGRTGSGHRRPTLQRNSRVKELTARRPSEEPDAAERTSAYGAVPPLQTTRPAPQRVESSYGTVPPDLPKPAPQRVESSYGTVPPDMPISASSTYGIAPPQSEYASLVDAKPVLAPQSHMSNSYGEAPPANPTYGSSPQRLVKPAKAKPLKRENPSPPVSAPLQKSVYGEAPPPRMSRSGQPMSSSSVGNSTFSMSDSHAYPNEDPPPPPFDDSLHPPPPFEEDVHPPPEPVEDSVQYPLPPPRSVITSLESELDPRFLIGVQELTKYERIGSGHTGIVFRGVWRHTAVAIKELKHTDNKQHMEDFRAEARQLMALRPHTNVAQLFGVCVDPLALVCAFYPRGSLDKWLKALPGPLPMPNVVRMLLGVASGVHHLHLEGVVHRDLAARNVLLADGDVPKLTDFGLSRAAQAGVTLQTATVSGLPLKWMAPEQLHVNTRHYSSASDVWSFGVFCVEVLIRQPPWEGYTPADAAVRTLKGERLAMPAETPPWLRGLINACWVEAERRPTMDSCHQELQKQAEAAGIALTTSHSAFDAQSAMGGALPVAPDSGEAPEHAGPPEIDVRELRFDREHDLIGQGTYGKVYRGTCRGQTVAIKVPQQQELTEAQLRDFRNEVSIMRRIYHPAVVLFLGACSAPGSIMLVTEFLEGGDLDGVLHSRPEDHVLTMATKLGFMMDTAKALNWLHGINSIVHRDLKPANLLVDDAMHVKVTDFGFSQLRSDDPLQDEKGPKGSALWMAPEVFLKQPFTEKIDVYAFGLICWEILTEEWLFPNYSELNEFRAAITVRRERPPITRSMCAPSLAAMMQQCWAHDPNDRPTMGAVLTMLEAARLDQLLTPGAARFWSANMGTNLSVIDWAGFSRMLATSCRVSMDTVKVLEPYVVDEMDRQGRVTLQSFGDACDKFGPFHGPGPAHIQWVAWLVTSIAFHGAIERDEVERRLRGRPRGTYLVRCGGKEDHPFTISVMMSGGVQHKRVRHVWGTAEWSIAVEGKTYTFATLDHLLKSRECRFGSPCPKPIRKQQKKHLYDEV